MGVVGNNIFKGKEANNLEMDEKVTAELNDGSGEEYCVGKPGCL